MGLFSLRERKKAIDISPFMRRIVDLTTPALLRADENRIDRRYNRALPVAICPWNQSKLDITHVTLGITRDLSEHGISVLTTEALGFEESVFTIMVDSEIADELWFFQATVMRRSKVFGFEESGLRINEFLNENHRSLVLPLSDKLSHIEN